MSRYPRKDVPHNKSLQFGALIVLFVTLLVSCASPAPSGGGSQTSCSTTTPSSGLNGTACESTLTPGSTPTPACVPASADAHVAVDLSAPLLTSQFSPGLTLVDNSLTYPYNDNDLTAINNVEALIHKGITYISTPIMAWGVDDPWPDPTQSEPTNWESLDARVRLIVQMGGVPVITLSEAPWWMKGVLEPQGTTHLITQSEEWLDIAYSARILDNQMGAWLKLVQRVAERYMVPPFNVRYFQVWNELKGYYDPITNAYDYTTSPGKPDGPNARHGYTYMYNQVYNTLMQVASSLNVSAGSVKVGGPYVVMDTWSSTEQSNPSNITKAYGTYDQRSLDVVLYWLQHKVGAGFITLDSSSSNKDNVNITDPFTAAQKFADATQWIRSLDPSQFPGAASLPIWWAEWYAKPYTNVSDANYNDAVKSYAMIELVKAGSAVALSWGGLGDGPPNTGLWTNTTAGGGQPLPWYFSYKAFKDDFSSGTRIYATNSSAPNLVEALAAATKVMLVNKTAKSVSVTVGCARVTLSPYQVQVIAL
ncbi:MAG TPA: hypothetical protein VKR83_15375 [Ktedonobacteraceae bacterium]|nr:hypothetical protein [Ktedonobacteraceae bacterium]